MQQDLFALFISSTYPVNWWLQIMFAVFHLICSCQKYLTITWLQQGFFFELGYVSRGDCQRMSKAFFVATQSLCLHVSLAQSTHELTSCWWVDSLLVDSSIKEVVLAHYNIKDIYVFVSFAWIMVLDETFRTFLLVELVLALLCFSTKDFFSFFHVSWWEIVSSFLKHTAPQC